MLHQKNIGENMSDFRVIGIDASLSSTGFTSAEINVDRKYFSKHKSNLFKILTTKYGEEIPEKCLKSFEECFICLTANIIEIKEDKETLKELTKIRKQIREDKDQPCHKDLAKESQLEVKRITDQVTQIMKRIQDIHTEDPMKTFCFIEDYSYHSPGSLTQLAEMKGMLRVEMEKFIQSITKEFLDMQSYFFITANINTVKKVASLNGNAPKELICDQLKRFGFNYTVKEDDAADSIAVALAGFYSLYHMFNTFEVPECKTAKERNFYKSFIESLETFSTRIGSFEKLNELMHQW